MNIDKQRDPLEKDIKLILNLFNLDKLLEAKKEVEKQFINFPSSSVLFNILGAISANQKQLDKAVTHYKKALKLNPSYAQAYNNLGIALHKLNKINEAIKNYKKAIEYKADFEEAYNNLGSAIRDLKKPKEAIKYFENAIKIKSDYFEAYNNLGIAYLDINLKDQAVESFKKVIKIKPDYAIAHNSLGLVYHETKEYEDSILSFKKAIELNPNYEKPYNNLGNVLSDLGSYDEATNSYYQAIKIKPDYSKAYSNLLFNLNYKKEFDQNLYLSEAKKFRLNCAPNKGKLFKEHKFERNLKKINLGFVSADFGNHPGGYFTLSTLRELRKENFNLIAYSCFDRTDDYVYHFKPLFSKWHSIEKRNDKEVVQQIINDKIHILIDLQGHSAKNRLPIFIYKPAPIQITWLGQGSTGIPEIDYFVGSKHITPKKEEKNYVENIVRLPEISQCFTPPDFDLEINTLPAFKNGFLTFGCINKLSKLEEEVIVLWSKILQTIPKSKLLLKTQEFDNHKVRENILNKFKKNHIEEKQLILIGSSSNRKETLKIYNQIDIALDPFPFQGNTTTCEAIWMGVPVLTLKGDRYLSHFGESINSNINMQDWIAGNYSDYIAKAKKFSLNINILAKIRLNLREILIKSPVCDAKLFSKNFKQMLWKIWDDQFT